jgi:hypothetical protein
MFIFICGLFDDSVDSRRYVVSNYRNSSEQKTERMWKGAVMAQFQIPCRNFPVETGKTTQTPRMKLCYTYIYRFLWL